MTNVVNYLASTAADEIASGVSSLTRIAYSGGNLKNLNNHVFESTSGGISPSDIAQTERLRALERGLRDTPSYVKQNASRQSLNSKRDSVNRRDLLRANAPSLARPNSRPVYPEPYPSPVALVGADLPDRQRTVAYYLASGYSQSDIARILGVSPAAITKLVGKIRATILRALPHVGRDRV